MTSFLRWRYALLGATLAGGGGGWYFYNIRKRPVKLLYNGRQVRFPSTFSVADIKKVFCLTNVPGIEVVDSTEQPPKSKAQLLPNLSGKFCVSKGTYKVMSSLGEFPNMETLHLALLCSSLAYEDVPCHNIISNYSHIFLSCQQVRYGKDKNLSCLITETQDRVFVSFPGTKTFKDIQTDLSMFGLDKHQGFVSHSKLGLTSVINNPILTDKKEVILCGHSKGGAIAHIAHFELDTQHPSNRQIRSISFGAPLWGSSGIGQVINDQENARYTCVLTDGDIVPRLLTSKLRLQVLTSLGRFAEMVFTSAAKDWNITAIKKDLDDLGGLIVTEALPDYIPIGRFLVYSRGCPIIYNAKHHNFAQILNHNEINLERIADGISRHRLYNYFQAWDPYFQAVLKETQFPSRKNNRNTVSSPIPWLAPKIIDIVIYSQSMINIKGENLSDATLIEFIPRSYHLDRPVRLTNSDIPQSESSNITIDGKEFPKFNKVRVHTLYGKAEFVIHEYTPVKEANQQCSAANITFGIVLRARLQISTSKNEDALQRLGLSNRSRSNSFNSKTAASVMNENEDFLTRMADKEKDFADVHHDKTFSNLVKLITFGGIAVGLFSLSPMIGSGVIVAVPVFVGKAVHNLWRLIYDPITVKNLENNSLHDQKGWQIDINFYRLARLCGLVQDLNPVTAADLSYCREKIVELYDLIIEEKEHSNVNEIDILKKKLSAKNCDLVDATRKSLNTIYCLIKEYSALAYLWKWGSEIPYVIVQGPKHSGKSELVHSVFDISLSSSGDQITHDPLAGTKFVQLLTKGDLILVNTPGSNDLELDGELKKLIGETRKRVHPLTIFVLPYSDFYTTEKMDLLKSATERVNDTSRIVVVLNKIDQAQGVTPQGKEEVFKRLSAWHINRDQVLFTALKNDSKRITNEQLQEMGVLDQHQTCLHLTKYLDNTLDCSNIRKGWE